MLTKFEMKPETPILYICLSLEDGHYWDIPSYSKDIAIQKLKFISRNNKIIIEVG